MKRRQAPTRHEGDGHEDYKLTHPAFGCCQVTQWHGTGHRLFSSDLEHHTGITLKFHRATMYRGLSFDRHYAEEVLFECILSQAQWASLVSSQGLGMGVPVTITEARSGPLDDIPSIAAPEASRKELHGEEMAAALKERLDAISKCVADLGTHLAIGGTKRDLREMHKELARHVEQLPGSVQFVYDQFTEATEKVVADAKIEFEASVATTAQRLGLDHLRGLAPTMLGSTKPDGIIE